MWSAVAERSGDTAFALGVTDIFAENFRHVKAAWRFASRRTPKFAVRYAPFPLCARAALVV
jgi:hypothetical protein